MPDYPPFLTPPPPGPKRSPEGEQLLATAAEQWRQQHPIRAKISDGAEGLVNFIKGLTVGGSDQDWQEKNAARIGELTGAALPGVDDAARLAGLPFLAARAFTGFKSPVATLGGRIFRAAEEPHWAATFMREKGQLAPGAAMMPVQLDIKNALDLTPETLAGHQMQLDDLRKLYGQVPGLQKNVQKWKMGDEDQAFAARDEIARLIEKLLEQNPRALEPHGFDGVKFMDGTHPAWAATNPMQVINALTKERGVGPAR